MANDLKFHLSKDYFKIGSFGDKHVKNINIALLVSGIVIIVTIIFYLLMYTFTNFSTLDDLEDYSKDYQKKEDSHFTNIEMAAKIMPSYNFKENAIWMDKTREVSFDFLI